MIEMFVYGIAIDQKTKHPIVVLYDSGKRRALPIWIGAAEARSITLALEKSRQPRPMTHDLLLTAINSLGHKVDRVEINELSEDTYFATIFLSLPGVVKEDETQKTDKGESRVNDERYKTLDARPSDAIALALRAKAPIYVSAQVVADGTVPTDHERDEEEALEFKNFVSDLKASDFKMTGPDKS